MKTYSQVGQDLWVLEKLPPPYRGRFLDVGCNHPTALSNTKLLEEHGWTGVLVDSDAVAVEMCRRERSSRVILADATKLDYREIGAVDYLSLDIDHGTLEALRQILACGVTFGLATVEHDAYRFGDELRAEERRLLLAAGYVLMRENVGAPEWPFEDWWAAPAMKGG